MTRVVLTDLTRTWPGSAAPALDRLSLEVESGALVALLGPSGCGKTTALRLIAGLLGPTAGDIAFDGRSVLGLPPERRGAVLMFQDNLLFPHLDVAGNVGFGLRMRGLPRREISVRVAEMLARVQLPGFESRRPADLSGGQQQRVALARALIVRPRVLLLDEPLSNLDPNLRAEMQDLVRSLQRELGITTIFVTHDREEAVTMADRVALILGGRLRQHDVPEAFFRRPADAEVARFFGGRNFLPGRVTAGAFEGPLGRLALPPGLGDGPGTLTFRPESVRIGASAVNGLTLRLAERRDLGTRTHLRLVAEGGAAIEASLPPEPVAGGEPGDLVDVHLPPAALWVLR